MPITTKTGDQGTTSLWSGERVSKDHLRVEAYGTIDELDSFLAEVRHYVNDDNKVIIEQLQDILPIVMSELASTKADKYQLDGTHIDFINEKISKLEKLVSLNSFIKKGKSICSAKLDICNAIARRAERRIVTLMNKYQGNVNPLILVFINRLSDLLFLIARIEDL